MGQAGRTRHRDGRRGLASSERQELAELRRENRRLREDVDILKRATVSSLKGELIDDRAWPTRAGARRAVVDYIGWYNGTRLHSTLGYQSPADYENNHHENVRQVA
jgi:transposase InsO family protein